MQTLPDLDTERLISRLRDAFGVCAREIVFLPIGADTRSAAYRVTSAGDVCYFLKLRREPFYPLTVLLPAWLAEQGMDQIIAPLPTVSGQFWSGMYPFAMTLYPYVEGCDGYEVRLHPRHWAELGRILRRVHGAALPRELARQLRAETYSSRYHEQLRRHLPPDHRSDASDSLSRSLTAYLTTEHAQIATLLERTEELAGALQTDPPPSVLCHADIHAGNMFIDANAQLRLVDWDEAIHAPKERDLMSPGAGLGGGWLPPEEEEAAFYNGYGPTAVDSRALAYYRYERLITDLAEECEQIYAATVGQPDREQAFCWLQSNFAPGSVLERAQIADGACPGS